MTDLIRKSEPNASNVPAPEINFALVLSRMVDSLQQNPAELRATVYELARVKLKEQLYGEDVAETTRLAEALEEAIDAVEAFSRHEQAQKAGWAAAALLGPGSSVSTEAEQGIPSRVAQRPSGSDAAQRRDQQAFGPIRRLAMIAAVVAIVALAALAWPRVRTQLAGFTGRQIDAAALRSAQAPAAAPASIATRPPATEKPLLPFPLPTTFGVYAISDGQLKELKMLQGKVPDMRVAVSAAISTPSETTISDRNPKFIVFRRDGASSAPDHVDVRVVAQVTRAMGVDGSGQAKLAPSQSTWVIRNFTIPYNVGPVEDHPEMFLIQAEKPDDLLSAGRYALVLKGQAYDFSVGGSVTDPRQCLERLDAVNGTFYSPCPKIGK